MKKSKLLTLATTAAVVAVSAGTFAIWDEVNVTTSKALTVTFDKTTMSVSSHLDFNTTPTQDGENLIYEGSFTLDVDAPDSLSQIALTPKVEATGVTGVTADAITIINDDTDNNIDASVESSNVYNVKLTLTKDQATKLKGVTDGVKVTIDAQGTTVK